MEVNYIAESFKFMLFGMGIVFIFLFLLIQVVKIQAFLIKKYLPETKKNIDNVPLSNSNNQKDISREIAVITAAISEFKK